jgi:hypothetical protein
MILSARSSGGMVRPSALAVFSLMTSSKLVGCSMGRFARLGALENAVRLSRVVKGPAVHGVKEAA